MNKQNTPISIPICIIGAGGIVNDAHLPAYAIAGYKIAGIIDKNKDRAITLAEKFGIEKVYNTLQEMVEHNGNGVIYDLALPASEIIETLQHLPIQSTVLIQKPLGENIEEATAILQLTQQKQIQAGVNFQLRFAPFILETKKILNQGLIGDIADIEVYVNVFTPWHLWDFLFTKPRMEILYHSIHYIDFIRSMLGNPQKVLARSFKHPQSAQLSSVRSNIIMDYGDLLRAVIHTNHNHNYGYTHQQSYIKIEGTKGAVKINFGALINYPHGTPDSFEYYTAEANQWQQKKIQGSWFPEAFIGTMQQMMLVKAGIISHPENCITDAYDTMRCVEAAYKSNEESGVFFSLI